MLKKPLIKMAEIAEFQPTATVATAVSTTATEQTTDQPSQAQPVIVQTGSTSQAQVRFLSRII